MTQKKEEHVDIYQRFIKKVLKEDQLHKLSDNEISDRFLEFVDYHAEILVQNIYSITDEQITLNSRVNKEFTTKHYKFWKAGLDQLEMLITTCIEAGSGFNQSRAEEPNLLLEVLVRLHAKACNISIEILHLLKGGFADAAHARWRALHEVNVTILFISKHGTECAVRFLDHEIIDCYEGMLSHKKFEKRIQSVGPTLMEVEEVTNLYNATIKKYGKSFKYQYGWAKEFIESDNKIGFQSIEKNVDLDHMRPYFKWASQNIHTSSMSLTKSLSTPIFDQNTILVGPSNYGLTDPAHSTALSLGQSTAALIINQDNGDNTVLMQAIMKITVKIGDTFTLLSKKM